MSLQVWMPLIKDYENYGLSNLRFANFRYIRFVINAIKGGTDSYTQLSRLEFIDAEGDLYKYPAGTTVSSSMTGYPASEPPASIIDGNVNTKFCAPWSAGGYLTIALGSSETIDISRYSRFQWYTANDGDWRDPISFEVQFSNDGANFVKGAVVTNASITSTRYALAYTGNCFSASVGKIGSSCYYNTSYSTGGLVSDIKLNLGNRLSMCCWVKFSSLLSDSALGASMGGQHRYPNNTGMGLTIKYVSSSTGYLSCNTGNGSDRTYNTYCGNTLLSAGTWYHVVFTYDGSTIKFYVNGNLDGTHSYTGQKNVEDYVFIGAWSFEANTDSPTMYGQYKLNGCMNDFRIYDHVLSKKEIKLLSHGLVAHYQLKGSYESTREPDCSGYGNHATKVGTLNISSDSPRYSGAYIFPNSSYIACGRGAMVRDAITVSCWGYMDNWSSITGQLVSCTEGGGWGLGYGANTAGHGFELYSNGYYGIDLAFTSLSTGWHHFAATYNGNTIVGYVDGVEKARKTGVGTGIGYNASNGIFIGAEAGSNATTAAGSYFNGRISDVRIYGTALSASDILDMYKHNVCLTNDGKLFANVFNESDKNTIEKTGTVTTNSFNLKNVPTYDMKLKALDDGSTWARIHNLDVSSNRTWFTTSEVDKCTDKSNRYSRMRDADKYKSSDGSYEFMLTYPSMKKSVPAGYTELEYIEATGTQYINTGVKGNARWEFDIEFKTGISHRQLMGYGGNGQEYWGVQVHGGYGVHEDGTLVGVSAGKRDTIVQSFGENSDYSIWVQNKSVSVTSRDVSASEYQLFCIMDMASSFGCYAKLWRCKCVQGGSLIRDFIPAKRNSDGAIGLVDIVNNVFYANAGSDTFAAGYKKGYQWLDYIENATGVEYINTGFAAPEGFITEAVVEYLTYAGGYFVGSHNIGEPYGRNGVGINTVGWEIGTGDTCPNSPSLPTLNTKYSVKASTVKGNSYIDLDGTRVVSTTDSSSRCTDNLYVFYDQYSLYHGHTTSRVRIYSLKIYQPDGTLVRDYLPCINPANEVGLYDKVTGVFYKNVGAGQLISGTTQYSVPLYNRWIQTSSPNASSVTGFKPITTAWTAHHAGLRRHGSSCIYNCDTGDTWYAPIGQTSTWTDTQYIPAADGSSQTKTELWVRTDRFSDANQFKIYDGSMVATDYIEF